MKKTILLFAVLFTCMVSLFSQILPTAHFSEILNHLSCHTLVVLDIDDTLIIPEQTLGNDAWFLYRIKELEKRGMEPTEAFERALADWQAVRHLTKMKCVEKECPAIVDQIQKQGYTVIALTTQGLGLANRTYRQLVGCGIDMKKNAPCAEDHYFMNGQQGVLYRNGILFTAGTPKGEALFKWMEWACCKPERILFINDKEKHLRDVEKVALERKVAFTGLRYSFCDAMTSAFDPKLATYQWEHSTFDHLLSDEEARKLLKDQDRI